MANLNMANMSSLDFCIWQHLKDHWNEIQLHYLSSIPSVPITQLYKHMISGNRPITPFTSPTESIDDTASIWTLISSHRSLCNGYRTSYTIWIGIFFCYFFWCQPARLVHQPLQPGSTCDILLWMMM